MPVFGSATKSFGAEERWKKWLRLSSVACFSLAHRGLLKLYCSNENATHALFGLGATGSVVRSADGASVPYGICLLLFSFVDSPVLGAYRNSALVFDVSDE